jgi:glycerol kinase
MGRLSHRCDQRASRGQLFNQETPEWDEKLHVGLEMARTMLPQADSSFDNSGVYFAPAFFRATCSLLERKQLGSISEG